MTERKIGAFLKRFLAEYPRRCGEIQGPYGAALCVARYHDVGAISLPQCFASARFDEAQRRRDELQEEREIKGKPGSVERAQKELEDVIFAAKTSEVQEMLKRPEELQRQDDEQCAAANGDLIRTRLTTIQPDSRINRR